MTAVASSESLRNDDELNQMVARVVCDPAQDKLEDDALNKGQDAERTKVSPTETLSTMVDKGGL